MSPQGSVTYLSNWQQLSTEELYTNSNSTSIIPTSVLILFDLPKFFCLGITLKSNYFNRVN